jgi:hypothetical protein
MNASFSELLIQNLGHVGHSKSIRGGVISRCR